MHYPTDHAPSPPSLPEERFSLDLFTAEVVSKLRATDRLLTINVGVGGSIIGDVVVDQGIAYFGCCDKNFYAVDAATGKEVWRFATQGPNIDCAVTKDTIYVASADGTLYALARDGTLQWTFKTNGRLTTHPVVLGGRIHIMGEDQFLYCLDREGVLQWKFDCGSPQVYNDLGHDHDTLYVGNANGIFTALDLQGKVKWRFVARNLCGGGAPRDDRVYVGSWDHHLYCLDKQTGRELWRFAAKDKMLSRNIVHAPDRLYVGSYDNSLYCLSPGGALLWSFPTRNPVFAFPVVDGDRLYFGSADSMLYCLDARTGKEVWRFASGGPIISNPALFQDSVIYGGYDCKLYCLGLDGGLRWTFPTSLSTVSPVDIVEVPKTAQTLELPAPGEAAPLPERYRAPDLPLQEPGSSPYTAPSPYATESVYDPRKRKGSGP